MLSSMKLKGSDGGLEQQLSLAICAVYLRNNYWNSKSLQIE